MKTSSDECFFISFTRLTLKIIKNWLLLLALPFKCKRSSLTLLHHDWLLSRQRIYNGGHMALNLLSLKVFLSSSGLFKFQSTVVILICHNLSTFANKNITWIIWDALLLILCILQLKDNRFIINKVRTKYLLYQVAART